MTKVSDDLRCRVDNARDLVIIHDELLITWGFAVDVSFMLLELSEALVWWRSFYSSCFNCDLRFDRYVFMCICVQY